MFGRTLTLAYLACYASASPLSHVLRDSVSVPAGFAQVGPASKDHVLNLRLGMVQGDPAGLEKVLMEVSDPEGPKYGQHLSSEEASTFSPGSDILYQPPSLGLCIPLSQERDRSSCICLAQGQ